MKNVVRKTKKTDQKIKQQEKLKKQATGITLIALVITIIVLLILARGKHSNTNWTKWNINEGKRCKVRNKRIKRRRSKRFMESKPKNR